VRERTGMPIPAREHDEVIVTVRVDPCLAGRSFDSSRELVARF
jgi:hypothetical protein